MRVGKLVLKSLPRLVNVQAQRGRERSGISTLRTIKASISAGWNLPRLALPLKRWVAQRQPRREPFFTQI